MFTICALYQFVPLEDFAKIRPPLYHLMKKLAIKGTILLAKEGINGTISGSDEAVHQVLNYLKYDLKLNQINEKFSYHKDLPFRRLKVKLKKEIVTMGVANINPKNLAGTYVCSKDWNALINDPQVVLIDTRNDYEHEIGTFKGSINPKTEAFRNFPQYVKNNLAQYRNQKVAMFCTGGIRCEKSTAYLKSQGFSQVYHLKGGVLKYLEDISKEDSLWQGECFVFDDRVAVGHYLAKGQYDQCHACRYPITITDKQHQYYKEGVSCPRCYGKKSHKQINRYQERQRQIQLAQQRGEPHIGDEASQLITKNKQTQA